MHWFDIADEAAHEDSLRALAAGGFDEVLDAIGRHFGLDHLVTFSIGLLAVSKADKGVRVRRFFFPFRSTRLGRAFFPARMRTPPSSDAVHGPERRSTSTWTSPNRRDARSTSS